MFTSANKQSGGGGNQEAKDSKRLKTISIPQQFAWTGLDGGVKKEATTFSMEGLVLWNVLGFALGDERDYTSFTAVNKEWNQIVKTLVPPTLFQMKAVLDRGTENQLVTEQDLPLLSQALQLLENRDSSLYRKDKTSASSSSQWPHLQPQFSMILTRFVYQACTQRNPLNRRIYEIVCNYLQEFGARMAQKMSESLSKEGATQEILEELVGYWQEWFGVTNTVNGIAGYLNRYYVKHHSLKSLVEHAQSCLVTAILRTADLPLNLERMLQNVYRSMDIIPRPFLVQAFDGIQKIGPLPPAVTLEWQGMVGIDRIREWYGQIKVVMEERVLPAELQAAIENPSGNAEENQGLGITILFPNGTKLEASTHFVESSWFLKNLHLRPGDVLRWDMDSELAAFGKVLEFYAIDERTPMPPIVTPLRTTVMSDLVGEEFARWIESLDQRALFTVVAIANFLDTKKLMDLSVVAVSLLLRRRSPAELRQIFNVTR